MTLLRTWRTIRLPVVNTTLRTQKITEIPPCGFFVQELRSQAGRQFPETFSDVFVTGIGGGFEAHQVCGIVFTSPA